MTSQADYELLSEKKSIEKQNLINLNELFQNKW